MLSNLYDQGVANNLRSSPKSCLILLLLFIYLPTYIVIHLFIRLSKWTAPKTVWHIAFFFFSKKLHKFDLLYPNSMKFCSQIATTSINPCSSLKLQFRWHFLTHCRKLPFIFEVKKFDIRFLQFFLIDICSLRVVCNHEVLRWPNFGLLCAQFLNSFWLT